MLTDCSSSINDSSSSSSDVASSRSGATPRIRVVRLSRPNLSARRTLNTNSSYGFAIRGGREFGIGFFVSRIEKGSEADLKGLRIGDQIVRVNGYLVDDAVHKELSQYMSCQDRLTLKVRGVGMLPIKEHMADPLTWHIVPLRALTSIEGLDEYKSQDVRVTLNIAPRSKLGLGICKGPEWKPGIFVQFTKEFSIAREAGLRPGDQLLSCNNIDFSNILFSEAVAVMKSSHSLDLLVRTAAGIDLFPGESSGYNSSASSITGDQSPCWGDQASKRLSIVKEEDGTEKLGYLRPKSWDRVDLDRRKDRLHAVKPPKIPNSSFSNHNHQHNHLNGTTNTQNNKTIIQLSSNGTLINNTLIPSNHNSDHENNNNKTTTTVFLGNDEKVTIKENSHITNSTRNNIKVNCNQLDCNNRSNCLPNGNPKKGTKIADICLVSRQSETKTVIVEVHRSPSDECNGDGGCTKSANIPPPPPPMVQLSGNPQDRNSLSSSMSIPSSCDGISLSSAISDELKKRAEKIKNQSGDEQRTKPSDICKNIKSSIGGQNSETHNALMDEFREKHKKMFRNGFRETENDSERHSPHKKFPSDDTTDNGYRVTEKNGIPKNGLKNIHLTKSSIDSHPSTPTPDYDLSPASSITSQSYQNFQSQPKPANGVGHTNSNSSHKGTMGRCAATEMAKANGDTAEMESIESFQLNNPSSPRPKPPSLYFNPQSSGPPTMKKSHRPVSVSIGEYIDRKEPNRFNFITKSENQNGVGQTNGTTPKNEQPNVDVSERLKNELEKTLSRSNLKTKNENDLDAITDKQMIVDNQKLTIGSKSQTNIEKITAMLVSQNFMNGSVDIAEAKLKLRSNENNVPINGILKNGNSNGSSPPVEQKNITFKGVCK